MQLRLLKQIALVLTLLRQLLAMKTPGNFPAPETYSHAWLVSWVHKVLRQTLKTARLMMMMCAPAELVLLLFRIVIVM